MYGIKTNGRKAIHIRPMKTKDLRMIVRSYKASEGEKQELMKEWENLFSYWGGDLSLVFYFTVLKGDKIIGEIAARILDDSPSEMLAIIRIQKSFKDLRPKVKELLIQMCNDFRICQNVLIVPEEKEISLERMVKIGSSTDTFLLKDVKEFLEV